MAAKNKDASSGLSLPMAGMFLMAIAGALVAGGSFEVIKVYPLPQSVDPYFGFAGGATWGLIAGAVVGLVIGFLSDDSHFSSQD